jgi:hypothetical protein
MNALKLLSKFLTADKLPNKNGEPWNPESAVLNFLLTKAAL